MGILEIGGVSVFVAFAAGLLSVASPWVLPLVPAYLGYLTGASLEGTPASQPVFVQQAAGAGGGTMTMSGPQIVTQSPMLHAVSFVAGFSLVFVVFGVSLGIVG